MWPESSALADYFLVGRPHMNFCEGSAHLDDLRLHTPED
ncbi:hypothetical protein HNR07_005644 [Nocardiopsis metallicus]|uniref:Uncharacterized protein n=1 Tax=Nocardiopsis metallicus TaxID=179819 RepID=A0A840WSH5_9ACTN|nr:hypothetical protein [Nocardiopsis metallicus]